MAMLARYAMRNATFRTLARDLELLGDGFPMHNLNRLLDYYPGADGVKIGYTDLAQKTIVAAAVHDGHRVYVSLMHSRRPGDRFVAPVRLGVGQLHLARSDGDRARALWPSLASWPSSAESARRHIRSSRSGIDPQGQLGPSASSRRDARPRGPPGPTSRATVCPGRAGAQQRAAASARKARPSPIGEPSAASAIALPTCERPSTIRAARDGDPLLRRLRRGRNARARQP